MKITINFEETDLKTSLTVNLVESIVIAMLFVLPTQSYFSSISRKVTSSSLKKT